VAAVPSGLNLTPLTIIIIRWNKGVEEIYVDFVKGKVVPGRRDPHINFGTGLKRVVSYTLRPLYFRGKNSSTHFIIYVCLVILDTVERRTSLTPAANSLVAQPIP
jgi:hypothetical protein